MNLEKNDVKKNPAIGEDAVAFMESFMTPEEIAESDLRVAIIGELIQARREKGITQQELEKRSGVAQPVIARMEHGTTTPRLDTVLKVLAALGKTLVVAPLPQKAAES